MKNLIRAALGIVFVCAASPALAVSVEVVLVDVVVPTKTQCGIALKPYDVWMLT